MEEELPKQPNKYITFIKTNKYNLYFVGAIIVILILIIGMLVLVTKSSHSNQAVNKSPNPTTSQTNIVSPSSDISPSSTTVSFITPNPSQAAIIENQTQPQITPNVAVSYTVSQIKEFGDDWAVMVINNPSVGHAIVIIQKVNNSWKVILGPGSFFTSQQLQSVGAPQSLINSFIPTTSPSPAP